MGKYYLGIDTSNYKTSVAIIDSEKNIVFNRSEYLNVKWGDKGLRQSDAFFMHSNRLPEFIANAFDTIDPSNISAIGVSTRPRRLEGSYMPCFLAGHNLARLIGSTLNIPVYEYSHQEGHAAAAMTADTCLYDNKSLFFHLSGGTTEFLICEPDQQGFDMNIIGGTKDISIGQLLDRVGVKMGMKFPSGKYLDEIANSTDITRVNKDTLSHIKQLVIKPRYDNYSFNLSGLETKLIRYLDTEPDSPNKDIMVKYLFIRIAELLLNIAKELSDKYQIDKVLMAGGVASSQTVRKIISEQDMDKSICFCSPELSGDNAVGVAILANRAYNR